MMTGINKKVGPAAHFDLLWARDWAGLVTLPVFVPI
jgi:hypothetical protein